jgi:hypothetical protein
VRVLSLSHRMQHRLIDNHTIFNAPAIFDYEGIVIDAGGVFDTIRQAVKAEAAFTTRGDIPVVNGESLDGVTGIADVLRRRREEFVRALERGSVVVVFAHAPDLITGVHGMHGLDRYFFLPAPPGMAWDASTLRATEGTTVAVSDPEHPFTRILDLLRSDVLYRCYFDERAPGFAGGARVFARSAGGAPVGVEFSVLGGRVVFLPTPRSAGANWLASAEGQAMVDVIGQLLGAADEDRPRWVLDMDVPGLREREDELRLAEQALRRAGTEVDELAGRVRQLELLRDVLWQGNEHALLPAVERCAGVLGLTPARGYEDVPLLKSPEGELHLVVAASREAVDMSAHYRLRGRLDREIELRTRAVRGLIVANGRRLQKPEDRKREVADALRIAAEATGYAVITSRWLFVAAVAALEGLDSETVAAIRRRLFETDGLVELSDLLVPAEEDADASVMPVEEVAGEGEAAEEELAAEPEPSGAEHRP